MVVVAGLFAVDILSGLDLDPSVFFWAGCAAVGALLGSLVRIVRRDKADVENKIKFLYFKDIFEIFVWTLVGGFFPLAFASVGWVPGLGVIISPFMPKAFDLMEENLPQAVLGSGKKMGELLEALVKGRNGGDKKNQETTTKEETK